MKALSLHVIMGPTLAKLNHFVFFFFFLLEENPEKVTDWQLRYHLASLIFPNHIPVLIFFKKIVDLLWAISPLLASCFLNDNSRLRVEKENYLETYTTLGMYPRLVKCKGKITDYLSGLMIWTGKALPNIPPEQDGHVTFDHYLCLVMHLDSEASVLEWGIMWFW